MSDQDNERDLGGLRAAALQVLREVIRGERFTSEYPTVASAMDDAALADLVDIAWRHQFDPDRYAFKRDINDLQLHVGKRVREALDNQ